jgi:Domain of unknown function (DUF5658)
MWTRVRARLRDIGDDHQQVGWLWTAVTAVLVLNLGDAIFTMWWVHAGVATEANVLLADLVEGNAVGFALSKSLLVSLGLLLLWRQRRRRLAAFGIGLVCVAYSALLLYHLGIAMVTSELKLA